MINYTWQTVESAIAINFVRSLDFSFLHLYLKSNAIFSYDSLKAL